MLRTIAQIKPSEAPAAEADAEAAGCSQLVRLSERGASEEKCPFCAHLTSPDIREASAPMDPEHTRRNPARPRLTVWSPLAAHLDSEAEGYAAQVGRRVPISDPPFQLATSHQIYISHAPYTT